jgi:hypothetical protein
MKRKLSPIYLAIGFFVLLALACVYWGAVNWYAHRALGTGNNPGDLGNFGSYIQGAVQSPWGLATVALLIATLLFQAEQLRLQREESAEQRKQFQRQDESATKQAFESTFFQLLKRQAELGAQMKVELTEDNSPTNAPDYPVAYAGLDCFPAIYPNFKEKLLARLCVPDLMKRLEIPIPPELERDEFKVTVGYYEEYLDKCPALGSYFKNLIHLFAFIERSEVKDKQWYADSVTLQLGREELALFYYHVISRDGRAIKTFTDEYRIFDKLDKSLLVDKPHKDFHLANFSWPVVTSKIFTETVKACEALSSNPPAPETAPAPVSNLSEAPPATRAA